MPKSPDKVRAIEFWAYIAPVASAITFGDDISRIKLDIPMNGKEGCPAQAKSLVDFQGKKLRVMVEVIDA